MVEKDHCEKTEKACDADQEQPIRSSDGFVGEWVLWIGFFFFWVCLLLWVWLWLWFDLWIYGFDFFFSEFVYIEEQVWEGCEKIKK